jgi:hypothetical protein|uniref:Uncharacterized protein n=1 Tax=viral metagenome TaxID=1070528 RepID=A0A6C0ITP2_9ZZZZ
MPRRHSSMGVFQPTHNMTITNTRVNKTGLNQQKALQNKFQYFIDKYITSQYVDNYNINDTTLQAYDTQYGQFIENQLQKFTGYNLSSEDNIWFQNNAKTYSDLVKNARQGFIIQQANQQQHAEIETLNNTITQLQQNLLDGNVQKSYQAPLMAEIDSDVSLDMRYWFYIKQFGPPDNGIFDPVKLAQFVFTDPNTGQAIPDQNSIQYANGDTNQGPDWSNGDTDPLLVNENITASNTDFDSGFNDDGNNNFWQ